MDDYPDNSRHQVSYNTGPPPTPASQQSSSNGAFIDSGMTDLPSEKTSGNGKKIIFPFLNKAPKGFLDAINYGVDNIVMPAVNEVARRFLYSFVDYFCDQVFHTNYRYRNVWDPRYMNGRGGVDYGRFSRQNQIIRDPDDSMYYYEGSFRTNRNQHFALHTVGFLSKDAAWKCISDMKQEIRLHGAVSVDFFYRYVNQPCPGRQGWRWGWRSLEDAVPVPTNRGFRIQFPELIPID